MFLPLAYENITFAEALGISGLGFAIVLAVLAVLALFIILLSKIINIGNTGKKKESKAEISAPAAATETAAPAPSVAEPEVKDSHVPGYVILDGVSEQDAAVIMAITADKTGVDLNRLDFRSIKRLNQDPVLENVSEQDAAAIMAITSAKTGIPLEKLAFNSIKKVED